MRVFVALDLPEEVTEAVASWWTAACLHLPASDWRDVPKGNWHITLAFFGEVDGGRLDDLAEAIAECAAGAPPFSLHLHGLGVFPRLQRARVFWLGVEAINGGNSLRLLAGCCRRAGFATVRKQTAKVDPFHGHITLARRRGQPEPLPPQILADMPAVPEAQWQAGCLRLYRSELHREGARYRILEEFELGGGA